jgi:hypothetical protein
MSRAACWDCSCPVRAVRLSTEHVPPTRLPTDLIRSGRLPTDQALASPLMPSAAPPGRLPTAPTPWSRRSPVCLWQWLVVSGGLLLVALFQPATVPLWAEEVRIFPLAGRFGLSWPISLGAEDGPMFPCFCRTAAGMEPSAGLPTEAHPAARLPEQPKPSASLPETKRTPFPTVSPNGPESAAGAENLRREDDPREDNQMYKLVLWDGRTMQAAWESGNAETLQFRTSDGKLVSVLPEELVRWGWPRPLRRGPVIVLADGSLLVGRVTRMTAMLLEIEPDMLEPQGQNACRMPVGQVVGVAFRLPTELGERDRLLDRLVRQLPEEDRLLLLNGDQVQGRLEAIEEQTVRLAGPLGPMPVPDSRIRAIQFRRLPRPASGQQAVRIWVGLEDGSLLLADRLTLQQSKATLHLPGRLSFQTDRENLVFLQPIGGRVVYLSDLKPKQYQFEPFFQMPWPWQADRSGTGTWLRVQGRRYLKGLGVHSKATLTYDLAGRYRWLEAELALDDTAEGRGSVIFRVLADGKLLYESPVISGGDPPQPIRLDIAHVRELELVVDYGPWGDMLDRANWLDARLIPANPPEQPASEPKTAPQ